MIAIADREGGVRVVTLSNPKKRNAFDAAQLAELRQAFQPAEHIRALVVIGEGEHFCSGYDLSGLDAIPEEGPLPDDALQEALRAVEAYPVPTIACVRGAAFGAGAELAAACDLRLFGDDAIYCLPPAKIGVVYAPEGIRRLEKLIGTARAKWLFFTGRRLSAQQCLAWGLCEELHPAAELEAKAHALADELAKNAPLSLRGMKQIFQGAPDPDSHGRRREAFRSEDAKEGRLALQQKRPPNFTGR